MQHLALLPVLVHSGFWFLSSAVPTCNPSYGHPNLADCAILAGELNYGWPTPDNLRRMGVQEGLLERAWAIGGDEPRPQGISVEVWNRRDGLALEATSGDCKMTLESMQSPGRSFTWDTGSYVAHIIPKAVDIMNLCMGYDGGTGGFDFAGARGQIVLSFMGPGSEADKSNTEGSDDNILQTYASTGRRLDGRLGISGLHWGSMTHAARAANFAALVFNDPNNVVPGGDWADANPKCGQPCSGSSNPCTGGCHCRGDPLDDPYPGETLTKLVYQPKCMDGYFAFLSRRRSLAYVPQGEEDIAIVLIEGPEPAKNKTTDLITTDTAAGVNFNRLGQVVAGAATCPCNCTYVSMSCCEQLGATRIVHEAPTLQMGVEYVEAGMCCDEGTGKARQGDRKKGSTVC